MKTKVLKFFRCFILLFVGLCSRFALFAETSTPYRFTEQDIQFLSQFSLENLPPLPSAPSNRVADNEAAAELGRHLFFDTRLSANAEISCATCHQPQKYFTDGLQRSEALGTTQRNAPSIVYAGYSSWLFWDGRRDSLWSQALEPIEHPLEQGFPRAQLAEFISTHYSTEYEQIFGTIDEYNTNELFANVGKAIMAYERRLVLQPSRLDRFIEVLKNNGAESELKKIFNEDEVYGLRLFVGRAACVSCHNGPLLTNFEFHNIGAPELDRENVDLGRYLGLQKLNTDEFTCLSRWSDADAESQCVEMNFLKSLGPELVGAFKTPSLRNVAATAPYMHSGQFENLQAVVEHYNEAKPPYYNREQHPNRPHFDLTPLNLSEKERQQLIAFLGTLSSPISNIDRWWQSPYE